MSSAKIPPRRASILRICLWIVLGGWLGIQLFFGFAVTPPTLRLVPSPQAGELVTAVLGALNWWGVACGISLATLAQTLRRGRIAITLPFVLVAACLVSQLVVSPAIGRVRLSDPANARKPEAALQFRRLHTVSVGLYGFTLVGLLALTVLHARSEPNEGDSPLL